MKITTDKDAKSAKKNLKRTFALFGCFAVAIFMVIGEPNSCCLLSIPNTDSNSSYLRLCKEFGLERHPARFPAELPAFFIKMLTEENDVVLDIFGGSNTTGFAAEALNRQWLTFELNRDYLVTSAFRFLEGYDGGEIKKVLNQLHVPGTSYLLGNVYCSLDSGTTVQHKQQRVRQPFLLQTENDDEIDNDFPLKDTVRLFIEPTEPVAQDDWAVLQ